MLVPNVILKSKNVNTTFSCGLILSLTWKYSVEEVFALDLVKEAGSLKCSGCLENTVVW